jgi:hypothetical protein
MYLLRLSWVPYALYEMHAIVRAFTRKGIGDRHKVRGRGVYCT